MEQRLKEIIVEVIDEKGAWLIEVEAMADHVHLLVEVDPQLGVRKLVKAIKGRSSRLLAGVSVAAVAVADVVDQLLFRGDGGWGVVVGDQTLRRSPKGPLNSCWWGGGFGWSSPTRRRCWPSRSGRRAGRCGARAWSSAASIGGAGRG